MRLVVSILILFAAQTVMAQTQWIGVPTVPKAQPAPEPSPAPQSPRLPPLQDPADPKQKSEFPQCSEGQSTGSADMAERMFAKILGIRSPFRAPFSNPESGDEFTLASQRGLLVAHVSVITATTSLCQVSETQLQVTLDVGEQYARLARGRFFNLKAERKGSNSVDIVSNNRRFQSGTFRRPLPGQLEADATR